jgi:hypothetical protein
MSDHIPDTGEMVPDAWMEAADRVLVPGKPMTTSDLRKALAAVAPRIAAAERERCAREVDCGCLNRDAVLSAETKADRWRACPRDPCGAVKAAAIRALGDEA